LRHKRLYAILISVLILDLTLAVSRIEFPSRNLTPSASHSPSAGEDIFNATFFVNGSPAPTNKSVVIDAFTSASLNIVIVPKMSISSASLNITAPSTLASLTGNTTYTGSISAHKSAVFYTGLTPLRESQFEVLVRAGGVVQQGSQTSLFTPIYEEYYLSVNTTNWPSMTKLNSTDPFPSNTTKIPAIRLSSTSLQLNGPALKMAPENPGTTTISGRLQYAGWNNGILLPMRYSRVELWEDGCCHAFPYATTMTEADGRFTFTLPNPGTLSVHVVALPESWCGNNNWQAPSGHVCYDIDHVISGINNFRTSLVDLVNVVDGSNVDIGTLAPAGDSIVWEINDLVITTNLKLSSGNIPVFNNAEQFGLQPFDGAGAGPFTFPDGTNFFPSNHAKYSHYDIDHEYGHAVMIHVIGDINNYPCNVVNGCFAFVTHTFENTNDARFAMSEGWAEFVQAFAEGNVLYASDACGNIETNHWFSDAVPAPNSMTCVGGAVHDGNTVEGSVASIFWDMYDSGRNGEPQGVGADDLNTLAGGHPLLMLDPILGPTGIFHQQHPGTILEFFSDWVARYPADTNTLCKIYKVYGVQGLPAACAAVSTSGFPAPAFLLAAMTVAIAIPVLRRRRS
jgi:hypothetical protein